MFSLHRSYFLVNSLCEYHVKSRGDHFLFGFFLLVWIFILLLLWTAFPCPVHWRWCCSLLFPSPLLSLSPPSPFPSPLFLFFPHVWPDSDAVGACPNTGARAEPAVWEGTGWKTPQRIRGHQGNPPPLALPAEWRASSPCWCSWRLALGFFFDLCRWLVLAWI